jgi:hypothetical protein
MFETERKFETAGESSNPEILDDYDISALTSSMAKEQLRIDHEHMVHYLGYLAMPKDLISDTPSYLNMSLAEARLFEPESPFVDEGRLDVVTRKDMHSRTLGHIAAKSLEMADNIGLVPDGEKIYFAVPKQDRFGDAKLFVGSPPFDMRENKDEYELNLDRFIDLDEKLTA